MTTEQKNEIRLLTIDFVSKNESQNKAAAKLTGVSSATLSQVINNKWELISSEMWTKLGKQVGFTSPEWSYCDTNVSKSIISWMDLARKGDVTNILGIIAPAGSGKTFTADYYKASHENTFLVKLKKGDTIRSLYKKILKELGISSEGMTSTKMGDEVYTKILKRTNPLLIIDEIDKAKFEVWEELISLYNVFSEKCNIVTLSTGVFQTKIVNGVNAGRASYDEIHSRFGGSFVDIGGADAVDMASVVIANGIHDKNTINKIVDKCKRLERYDIRVGSDLIRIIKKKQNAA